MDGMQMPVSHVVGDAAATWLIWIPVTPLLVFFARMLTWRPRGWLMAFIGCVTVSFVVYFFQSWLRLWTGHYTGHALPSVRFPPSLESLAADQLLFDFLTCSAILSIASGVHLAQQAKARQRQTAQLEMQLIRARLETLQLRLQPHFLFNALNSIAMLIRADRKQQALDVVVGFGDLLRYVLEDSERTAVTLDEELGFAERYLDIERIRFGDRLHVDFDVPADTRSAHVPTLVLQPLIENALRHGIGTLLHGGRLHIAARREGLRLSLEVEDNGIGLGQDRHSARSGGHGLRNTRERLRAYFGDGATLTLSSSATGGALARMEVPFIAHPTAEDLLHE